MQTSGFGLDDFALVLKPKKLEIDNHAALGWRGWNAELDRHEFPNRQTGFHLARFHPVNRIHNVSNMRLH